MQPLQSIKAEHDLRRNNQTLAEALEKASRRKTTGNAWWYWKNI